MAPAETTLWFQIVPGDGDVDYIDIAQCLSLVNRRFYRQGYQYAVKELEFISDGTCALEVFTLPETWVMCNSWTKSWHLWKEMNKQVLDVSPSIQGTWADFKVFFDRYHRAATVTANLLPYGYAHTLGADDDYDWDMSEIVIPNELGPGVPGTFELHAIGDDNGVPPASASKGLITGYAQSRSRPQQSDPNVVDDNSWMNSLFDVGDQLPEIRAELEDSNDTPPYLIGADDSGEEYYPGGENQANVRGNFRKDVLHTRKGTALASDSFYGFVANLGLVAIAQTFGTVTEEDPTGINVRMVIERGPYQGVMARKMQDVN